MKKIIFLLCLVICKNLFAQEDNQVEVYLFNNSGVTAYVRVYPVSMVFNGYGQYSLISKGRFEYTFTENNIVKTRYYDYNTAERNEITNSVHEQKYDIVLPSNPTSFAGLKFDDGLNSPTAIAIKGIGMYKFEFKYTINGLNILDSAILYQDAGTFYDTKLYLGDYGEGLGLYYNAIYPGGTFGPTKKINYSGDFVNLIFPRYFGHNEECNRAVNLI